MREKDEPLDPQIEALRQRLMRLLRAGLILGFGAIAVVVALVYRFAGPGDSVPRPAISGGAIRSVALELPDGAKLLGTAIGPNRLALTFEMPDGRRVIRVVDNAGRPVVEYELGRGERSPRPDRP